MRRVQLWEQYCLKTMNKGKERYWSMEFASSSLNEPQRKYSAGELEIYAVIVALRKLKVYLQAAKKVIIITDHHPMKWLRAQRDPRNKYARWILEFKTSRNVVRRAWYAWKIKGRLRGRNR